MVPVAPTTKTSVGPLPHTPYRCFPVLVVMGDQEVHESFVLLRDHAVTEEQVARHEALEQPAAELLWVAGIGDPAFQEAAAHAKDNCPVSRLLKSGLAISMEATLES